MAAMVFHVFRLLACGEGSPAERYASLVDAGLLFAVTPGARFPGTGPSTVRALAGQVAFFAAIEAIEIHDRILSRADLYRLNHVSIYLLNYRCLHRSVRSSWGLSTAKLVDPA